MATWRRMEAADLDGVLAVAALVHPGLPERREVFAERIALFPAGCLVLDGPDGVVGYVVSHPWRALSAPPLDTLLASLPKPEQTRYVHDLALLPQARGQGAGEGVVSRIVADARAAGAPSLSLVSVHGSAPFWRRHGFADVEPALLAKSPLSYGPEARFMVRDLR